MKKKYTKFSISMGIHIFIAKVGYLIWPWLSESFENMDATDVNWEPILGMLPTQEMNDYDERMKYERLEFPF